MTEGPDALGVLDRITAVLEAFDGDDRGVGVSQLALRAGLPKSTVSRIVAGLVRQRYLERDGMLIHLGLRLFELGQLAEMPQELRFAALSVMADLRNTTGETVHLAIRDGSEVVYISIMRGHASAAPGSRIGGRAPVQATALGKALLAHAPAADIDAVLSAGLLASTPRTITDPGLLRTQLGEIRAAGLAVEVGEHGSGIAGVACPVFDPEGRAVAAISVCTDAGQFDPERVGPAVREAARKVEGRLRANRGR